MTPQQALELLYRAARLAALPANDHEAIAQAARVLADAITPPPANPEATPDRVAE